MDILLGEDTIWRNPFGLSVADRRQHVFAVGRTGTGKSTLLRNMMVQDIEAGRGCMLIDPHGDLAEELIDYVPRRRIEEVMYVAPADLSHPIGFNILERTAPDDQPLITASVVAIFERLWSRNWGPRSAYVLANVVAALLEYPQSRGSVSLLGVPRMLTDEGYRARIVKEIRDPRVGAFWCEEFAGWTPSFRAEVIAPLQNKAGMLLLSPALRNVLGQAHGALRFAEAMDQRRIIICNLSKGRLGEEPSQLVGSLFVAALQIATLRRASMPERERIDFVVYADEFHNYATSSFTTMLSESRKYAVGMVLATQFLEQIEPELRAAVFGNCGTLIAFGVGHTDADELAPEFSPYGVDTLTTLGRGEICVRSVRAGQMGEPFLAKTTPEIGRRYGGRAKVVEQSRRRYGRRREVVEAKLARWQRGSELGG